MLYHFQTKERDEPRARAGLLRVREFIMKDSYSFDRDEEGLDKSFQLHEGAYDRIFERCELEVYAVQAESGMMGGSESMTSSPRPAPGTTRSSRVRTATTPPISRSRAAFRVRPSFPDARRSRGRGDPGTTTIEDAAQLLGIDPAATSKAMPIVVDGSVVLALVRGDDRLDDVKLVEALGEAFRPATDEEIQATFGADPGSIGPVGVSVT